MHPDLVITGGEILDGSGQPPFTADLSIHAGRIEAINPSGLDPSIPRLSADGLFVAPGFIDIHSHSDFTLLVDPRAVSSISQGVTTEVVGNCGHGCAPVTDPERVKGNIYGYRPEFSIDWYTMGQYLERLEVGEPAVNVLSLVPNGNLRLTMPGSVDRAATASELRQMSALLEQGLEEGAFGFSSGLEYATEKACDEETIAGFCRLTARTGRFYATHTRNRDGEAIETIAEAIRTAAAADLALQISHISVVARLVDDSAWAVTQALDQVDAANRSGLDVTFDMHTRLFGTTNLSAALPPELFEGDRATVTARLQSPTTRTAIRSYPSIVTALARGDWNRIVLGRSRAHPEYTNLSLAAISTDRGVDTWATIFDLLLDEVDDPHGLMILAFSYRQEDLHQAFTHPSCMIGSDATTLAPDGPLADTVFHGAYSWAAWFYRHFVRNNRILSPQEAIRRLTSLPARRLGFSDRGCIRVGAYADLAIFDPSAFGENASIHAPNRTATGMVHVLVNGCPTVKDGLLTGRRAGKVLRRN